MDNETLVALEKCPKDSSGYNYFTSFLPLLYGIPTCILNVILIAIIVRNRSLHRVFFYQFIVFGTGNTFYWISSVIMDRFLMLPSLCPMFVRMFTKPHVIMKTIYMFYCYGIDNYFYSSLCIILWRVLVIFKSPYNENIKPRNLTIYLLIQFLLPFTFFWIYFNTSAFYSFAQPGSPKILFFAVGWPYITAAGVSGIKFGLLTILIIISSIYMLYRLVQIRTVESNKAERNIIITCLTFSLSAILISVYQATVYYFLSIAMDLNMTGIVVSYRAIVIDVAALLPSWCFLLTSTQIREKILGAKKTPISTRVHSRYNPTITVQ